MGSRRYATAQEAFESRATEVETVLGRLTTALKAKREHEARDSANWGHTGDLAHVAGLLNQALAFIGVKENEREA